MMKLLLFAVALTLSGTSHGRLLPRKEIVLDKKNAFNFLGFFNDIDHECYEEGCTFSEVVDHYGYSEKSYEYWNTYQCKKFEKDCEDIACRGNSLGMEDDTISGGGILASSWFSPHVGYAPSQGRLNNEEGAWCPNKPDEDPNPYLQIELPQRSGVCAVATQGSSQYDTDYVTKYEIQTSLDRENWETYKENGTNKVFTGNSNAKDMFKDNLDEPVLALFVRFVPKEWSSWPCMRVEVYGKPASHIRSLGLGLELACNGGLCWGTLLLRRDGRHLHLKRLPALTSVASQLQSNTKNGKDCTVRTTDNKCCVFPFLYEGERHFTCASTFFGEKWCATTYNYDEDEEWGECLEEDLKVKK